MKALYLLFSEDFDEIFANLSAKFKNLAVFEPNFDGSRESLIATINEFDEICKQNFTIVRPNPSVGLYGKFELNLRLAKELNCPIFASKNIAQIRELNGVSGLVISDSIDEILACEQNIVTPLRFELWLSKKAKILNKHIVLPEGEDERILRAADAVLADDLARITLLGDDSKIRSRASTLGLKNLSKANIINHEISELGVKFAEQIYELRKDKGVSSDSAQKLVRERNYFATMLVLNNYADAVVSGAVGTTADTIRPALQLIKTKPEVSVVSGLFFMALGEEIALYADCAITPNPDANALASIALSCAKSARSFGIEPRVAMLSYSTADSGSGPSVDMVKAAAVIALEKDPTLKLAAPIQFDAAVDKSVAAKKMPQNQIAGSANVFVFPDLNSANICYKAVQRTSGAIAIGPILQGLKRPVNDLSRGALVPDIINTILITAIQAGENR